MPRRRTTTTTTSSRRRRSTATKSRRRRQASASRRRRTPTRSRRARGGGVAVNAAAPCQFDPSTAYKAAPNSGCETCGNFSPDMTTRTFDARQPHWGPSAV